MFLLRWLNPFRIARLLNDLEMIADYIRPQITYSKDPRKKK